MILNMHCVTVPRQVCLVKMFQAPQIKVTTRDFVREKNGNKYITTRLLPGFIQQWKDWNHYNQDISKCFQELSVSRPLDLKRIKQVDDRGSTIQKIPKEVNRVSRICCNQESRSSFAGISENEWSPAWSFTFKDSDVHSCFEIDFVNAARWINNPESKPASRSWRYAKVLEERFFESKLVPK